MPTVNYTLRIDETDKYNAETVFKGLGMSFATGINIYLKIVGRQQKIPFVLALNEQETSLKDTAWCEFKHTIDNSSDENELLTDSVFTRRDGGRELIDFSNGAV